MSASEYSISDITHILHQNGPQTGAELAARLGAEDSLPLWRRCASAPELVCRRIGRRYLRLDYAVEGYARLSPSIRREFLTYTLVATPDQGEAMNQRARDMEADAARISREKRELALQSICMALSSLPQEDVILKHTTFIIAGDITYHMAHRVPRPEKSTGHMVRGSDLDIIAITTDDLPPSLCNALDAAIYNQKHYLLTHPDHQEEIDYILKPFSKVRQQLAFDSLEHMIACKILCEGELLYGSPFLFQDVKAAVRASGVPEKIGAMQAQAEQFRRQAEATLLDGNPDGRPQEDALLNLFYTREEGDEIY